MQLTTLGEVLTFAERSFKAAKLYFGHGTNNAWDEAVAIAVYVLQLPPDVDASVKDRVLSVEEKERLLALIERRIKERKPVPYLSHEAWFAGLKFYVDENVIIPRSPFAELITNHFQPWLSKKPVHRVLDLCTGSGCMAIATAFAFPEAVVDAVDISKPALAVAKKNVTLHGLEKRVNLIESDLFKACQGDYDIIISNPPYVDAKAMKALPKEYHFEPTLALAAGYDGLDIAKRILQEAPRYLRKGGLLFLEVGDSEAAFRKQYPELPVTWLNFERGGHGVFLLRRGENTCWQAY